jgi:hypothetical protein
MKKNNFKKVIALFGSFKKTSYLCTRNQEMNATQV